MGSAAHAAATRWSTDVREVRLEEQQDDELLARFRAGEPEAFGVLLLRYQRPIYNFLLRSVNAPEIAQDLAQEVFVRVIENVDGFQAKSKFSTWLYSVARNLSIDHHRRMRHRRHVSLDQGRERESGETAPLVERLAAEQPGVDQRSAAGDLQARIGAAVEQLPDEQREVFLLRQVQGMPFAEIASVVGVPENTVKSRMRYALERLQQVLAEERDDGAEAAS
jgi:RNA polymerase sigma-70 factor (ECF subfamily)